MKMAAGIGVFDKEPKISDGTVHAWIILAKDKDGNLFFPPSGDVVGKEISAGYKFSYPFDDAEIKIMPYKPSKYTPQPWFGVKGKVLTAKSQCKWAVQEGLFYRRWWYEYFYIILDCVIKERKKYYIDEVINPNKDMFVEEAVVEKVYDKVKWVSYVKFEFDD